MAIQQLPHPYPEELFYSVICRYFEYFRPRGLVLAAKLLFGNRTSALVEFPRRLDHFLRKTHHTFGMAADDIIENCSLFPYYSTFADEAVIAACKRAMCGGDDSLLIHSRLGLSNFGSVIKRGRFLLSCPLCVNADLQEFGETFWRREHQLPGTMVCPIHDIVLNETTAWLHPPRNCFQDATRILRENAGQPVAKLTAQDFETAKKIAVRNSEFLRNIRGAWPETQTADAYRNWALSRGFRRGLFIVDSEALVEEFVRFYGTELLTSIGCNIERIAHWLPTMLRHGRTVHNPLQHVLVQLFLETKELVPQVINVGSGPWRCPSPIAKHEGTHPITKALVRYRKSKSGVVFASARCSCGFAFTFKEISKEDPSIPIVERVARYGAAYQLEAARLARVGYNAREVAKKLKIKHDVAWRLIKSPDRSAQLRAQIEMSREQWSLNRSRQAYEKLRLHDRDWLASQGRKKRDLGQFRNKRDKKILRRWQSRDIEWSTLIPKAAAEIRAQLPVKKVTMAAIAHLAGQPQLLSNLSRLPLCSQSLRKCTETLREWHDRKAGSADFSQG